MKANRFFLCMIRVQVALALLVLPAVVQAQFVFTTNNGAITITGYTGPGGALTIPDSTNGFPVTSVGVNALFGNASLTSITIGTNVTSIGLDAFAYCYKLTAITVDTNNPAYSSIAGVLFDKGKTTLIEYPAASAETSYTIAASVTNIGDYAFGASTNLTSITIPNTVTSIGENAFNYCTSLTSLAIPYGVTSIATNTFITCFSLVSVTIPDSVTNIGYAAFYECGKLAGITLPDSVVSLGTLAFASCGLTNVTIPGRVTSVEQYAFASCASLTNVCFEGNAPGFGSQVFIDDPLPAIFYVSRATGWGTNYDGIPIEVCAQCVEVGALQIIINPICAVENGAAWQVDGGAWQTSGAVVTNLAVGYHTVAFTNIVGWLTPGSQMVPVTANSTNTVDGNYIEGSTPGLITWINIGGPDQHWSTPANWDLNRAPTTNDIVLIPNTGGNTCIMDVDATVAGLVIGDCDGGGSDGLEINLHTLTVTGLLTIKSNAVFRVDSGLLMGTSNTIISGVLGWTSGGLAGTLKLASNSVLNISGNPGGQYFSGCTLTNYGTVNWSDDALSAGGSVVIDNYGVWNAQDDHYFYGPNVVFNNYGTFRKSGGAGGYPGTYLYNGAMFNNYGTFRKSGGVGGYPGTYFYNGAVFNQLAGVLDVQSGTNGLELTLASGGSFTGGYVTTNLNGITLLGNNFNINGGTTCSNVILGGNLIGTNVISGGLTWQNGQWNNTVVTVSSNSILTLNNPTYQKGINGSILTNYGTVNWSAAAVNGDGGTVIDNYGVWNAQDDQYFNGGNYGAVFNNYGTFRKSGGVGGYPGTFFNSGAVFNQLAGVVDIQSGTNGLWLSLTSSGNFTGGYVTTNLNGITYLGGGNFNLNGTITCTNVLFGGGYLVGTNVIRGGLNWQNGQWNNTVVTLSSNNVLIINNSAFTKCINGSILTNYGTVNWSAGAVNADGGTVIDNYGQWNAQSSQTFYGSVVFNNIGTFIKSGGVGGYPGTYFYGGTTFNQAGGTLSVQTGDVTLGGTYSLTNGTLNFGINSLIDNGRLQLGTLTLGGTLSATVSGSFAPAVGDEFGVIGSSGLNGGFTSANLPAGIVVSNINNTVFLIVTGPVPVQLLNPQPVGTNFLFQFPTVSGQSYTVQRNDVLSSTNWVYYTNITGSGTLFQFQTPVTVTPPQRFFRVRQP